LEQQATTPVGSHAQQVVALVGMESCKQRRWDPGPIDGDGAVDERSKRWRQPDLDPMPVEA
jgi:hypothetical protein